jgi:excisionase family DNA binding protein
MRDSSRPFHARSPGQGVKLPPLGDYMLGVSQVARMLGMSSRTIRYLASLGDLPGMKVGRAWRFWRSEILEYLEAHRGKNLLG